MLELVLQQKPVKWDSKHEPARQRCSSAHRVPMVPHSKKLQPVAVQGHRVLLKPMFQKAKHLNSFSHLSVGSRDGEKSSSTRR